MKKKISLIILIILLCTITAFLSYIVISKQSQSKQTFNIKKGDVLKFPAHNINATILNVASTLCENKATCLFEGEVEVSIQIDYSGNKSSYTLKSVSNKEERIKNSNYYVSINYENRKIEINVREK